MVYCRPRRYGYRLEGGSGGTVIGSWTPKRFTHIRVLLNREGSNPSFIVWVNGSLYENSFSTSQPPQKLQLFDAIAIEVYNQITYVDAGKSVLLRKSIVKIEGVKIMLVQALMEWLQSVCSKRSKR